MLRGYFLLTYCCPYLTKCVLCVKKDNKTLFLQNDQMIYPSCYWYIIVLVCCNTLIKVRQTWFSLMWTGKLVRKRDDVNKLTTHTSTWSCCKHVFMLLFHKSHCYILSILIVVCFHSLHDVSYTAIFRWPSNYLICSVTWKGFFKGGIFLPSLVR